MRIDFNRAVGFHDIRQSFESFARWWLSELWPMIPSRWQQSLEAAFLRPVLRQDGTRWIISWPRHARPDLVLDASRSMPDLHDMIQRGNPELGERGVILELSPRDVLLRTIRLPAAAIARLGSAVELQLDRLSPFRPDEVLFDCRAGELQGDAGILIVEVAIIPKTTIDRYNAWLGGVGLRASEFRVPETPHRFRTPNRLSWRDRRLLAAGIAISGLVLWTAALLCAPALRDSELGSMSASVGSLRMASTEATGARNTLDGLAAPIGFIEAKQDNPTPLDVLKLLTKLLSNDTQLTELEVGSDRASATAISADPASALRALARSSFIRNAHLLGPITRTSTGRSLFSIEMQVRPHVH